MMAKKTADMTQFCFGSAYVQIDGDLFEVVSWTLSIRPNEGIKKQGTLVSQEAKRVVEFTLDEQGCLFFERYFPPQVVFEVTPLDSA